MLDYSLTYFMRQVQVVSYPCSCIMCCNCLLSTSEHFLKAQMGGKGKEPSGFLSFIAAGLRHNKK